MTGKEEKGSGSFFRLRDLPRSSASFLEISACGWYSYTFQRGDDEIMLAAWIPGRTKDGIVESKSDVMLPGVQARRAWVIDLMNGTEQELNVTREGDDTALKGMLIKDYPTFVRFSR